MLYLFFLILLLAISFLILGHLLYRLIIAPGAVYFPTPTQTIHQMLDLAQVGPKDTVIDLGSGDGRILIEAAKRGAKAIGYEIDPILVSQSRRLAKKENLSHLITVRHQNMWRADFNQATIITLYLFPNFMDRLQRLLENKLTHPLKLVSHDYRFTHKKEQKNINNIYLYTFPYIKTDSK